jgi:hypothetical protein
MFFSYHVDGPYRGQWRPIGGSASNNPGGNGDDGSGDNNPGGNDPGGNGGNDPGGNDQGGNDPGGNGSTFEITPTSIVVAGDDTSAKKITITCPDNTWTVVAGVKSWVTAVKTSSTQASITLSQNTDSTDRVMNVSFLWTDSTGKQITRTLGITQSAHEEEVDPGGQTPHDIEFSGVISDGGAPVSGVLVKIPTSASSQIGEATTDSEGRYSVVWSGVTEEDYNTEIYTSITIKTSKAGYTDGAVVVQKPTYSSAITNGVTINATISAMQGELSEFYASPGNVELLWNTSSVGVDIICPDSAWSVISYPDFVRLYTSRLSSPTHADQLLITPTANNTTGAEKTGEIVIGWGGQQTTIKVSQLAQTAAESTVIFRGRVMDGSTNSPLVGATVSIGAGFSSAGLLGTTTTDANGNYSYEWRVDEDKWMHTTDVSVTVEKAGYESNAVEVYRGIYDDAVVNGIRVDAITLTRAESPFSISSTKIDFGRNGGTHDVKVTCPDNTWTAGTGLESIYDNHHKLLPINDSFFSVTKLNDTTIRVVGKGNTTTSTWGMWLEVKWGDTILFCDVTHHN